MKILFIITDMRIGGAERVCLNLANYMVKNNFNVSVAVLFRRGEFLKKLDKKIEIIDLNCSRIRYAFFKLIPIFLLNKFDRIYTHCWPLSSVSIFSWLLCFFKGKIYPLEQIHFSTEIKNNLKISYFKFKFFITLSHFFCSKVLAVSEGVKLDLIKLCPVLKKKIFVIYNPVVEDKVKFKINQTSLKNKSFKCIGVGRLKKQKDFKNLIHSFYFLKSKINAILYIYGEGEMFIKLKNLIRDLNLTKNVYLMGQKNNINFHYTTSDIFVLPSEWEGFGNVIVEAMSNSLVVVSTDCKSGPSEILNNSLKTSLVPIKNPKLLSSKIIAISKTSKSVYFKKKYFRRSQDFLISKIAKKMINI